MISKEAFIGSVLHEFAIIRHLAEKLREEDLQYRPNEKQRSILETLQYISIIIGVTIESVVSGDKTLFTKESERVKDLKLEDFAAAMDAQADKVKNLVMSMSDEQLNEEVDFWVKQTRALHCMMALKFAVAYKMQLFLFMKAAGHTELSTMNAWAGADAPVKA